MKTETAQFLETARDMVDRGQRMLAVDLFEDAGRTACLAAFNAEAIIFERHGRSVKTHRGVQSEFSRLIRDEPSMPAELRGFLSRAYAFKMIADYDPQTSVPPTPEDVRAALDNAA